jgi:TolB protein
MHPSRKAIACLILLMNLVLILASGRSIHAQENDRFAGMLAFVGADGNVYLLDAPGTNPVALTSDATRGSRIYSWPTWSNDGRLAFFSQEIAQRGAQTSILLKVFIAPSGSMAPAPVYESESETFTYAFWAPAHCPDSESCRDLAVLTTTPGGLSVVRIRDGSPAVSAQTIGTGSPFYYSYSPDARRMIWQRFGNRLELYDTASEAIIERLPDTVGFFQAPMWSPVDNRLLFSIISDRNEHDLVIADGSERQVVAADQRGVLSFAWSPDGRYVAYKLDFGPLIIVDSRDGHEISRSPQSTVLAFFWSPDARRIAYLTLQANENGIQANLPVPGIRAAPARQDTPLTLQWSVTDLTTGASWTYRQGFLPTQEMVYYIRFFDQFAQSHQLWSPDSRFLAYGAFSADGVPTILLLDTSDVAARPETLVEGSMAIWSYQ